MYITVRNNIKQQSGAVLIISLLMLVVLTLLGVTAMSSSTMGEKMSANNMNYNAAFHASESAVEAALDDASSLAQAINSAAPVTITVDLGDPNISTSADVTYLGSGIALGFSLGQNSSSFSSYRFDATGTAIKNNVGAKTITSQGVHRVGPKA